MKKLLSSLMIVLVTVFAFAYFNIVSVGAASAWPTIEIEIDGIQNVYTNPGEDTTTQVTISWHSSNPNCRLFLTTADDTNFENAAIYDVTGVLDDKKSFNFYEKVTFYKCVQEIVNLTPGTDYIYKISTQNKSRKMVTTSIKTFRTSIVTDYSFAWISDIHTIHGDDGYGGNQGYRVKLATTLINKARETVDDIDFIVTTGDEVWRGSQYSNWQEWSYEATGYSDLTSSVLWCGGIGNHEYYSQFQSSLWNYYPQELTNSPSDIYGNYDYYSNVAFNAMKAVPDNGPTGTKYETSAYWFLAGSVLFIELDSMEMTDFGQFRQYQTWFENVLTALEGKYQYIVVGEHYAWIDPNDGADKGKNNSMSKWCELFDKWGVDLAISGHEHTYYRSVELYNKKPVTGGQRGTTYMVAPQIGNRTSMNDAGDWNGYWVDPSKQSNKNWIACNIDDRQLANKSGASIFTVTSTGLELTFIDASGRVKDHCIIPARRQIDCSTYAETIGNSLNAICNTTEHTAEFVLPQAYANLVSKMDIKNGNDVLGSLTQTQDITNSLVISNIQSNSLYELTIDFEFVDGSKYSMPYSLSTYPYFGEVYKFEPTFTKNNVTFKWVEEVLPAYSDLFSKYEIYADDTLLGTVNKGTCELSVSKDGLDMNANTVFKLKALTSQGNVVFIKTMNYHSVADTDLDGSVSGSDLDLISHYIFSGTSFTGNMKDTSDVNGDGKVDYIDIMTIWMYNKNSKLNELDKRTYTVVFKDLGGKVVATKNVKYGTDLSNIVGPTVQGYNFAGWSESVKYIESDMTVYAVYTK